MRQNVHQGKKQKEIVKKESCGLAADMSVGHSVIFVDMETDSNKYYLVLFQNERI